MGPTLSALRFFATNDRARSAGSHLWLRLGTALFAFLFAAACATTSAYADEDGVSFWIPGFFGSLAATPQQPGWSLAAINYYTDVSASGDAAWPGKSLSANPHDQCQRQRQRPRQSGSRSAHSDLCIRHSLPGRPGVGHSHRGLWKQRYLVERDGDRYRTPLLPLGSPSRASKTRWAVADLIPHVRRALECRREQLHGLYHRRYSGRQVQFDRSCEYRPRSRRARWRRRLHLFRSERLATNFQQWLD